MYIIHKYIQSRVLHKFCVETEHGVRIIIIIIIIIIIKLELFKACLSFRVSPSTHSELPQFTCSIQLAMMTVCTSDVSISPRITVG